MFIKNYTTHLRDVTERNHRAIGYSLWKGRGFERRQSFGSFPGETEQMVSGDLSGISKSRRCYDDQSIPDCNTRRKYINICRSYYRLTRVFEHSLVAKLHTSLRADRTKRGASSSDEPREFFISVSMTRKNRQHRPRITSPALRTQMIETCT